MELTDLYNLSRISDALPQTDAVRREPPGEATVAITEALDDTSREDASADEGKDEPVDMSVIGEEDLDVGEFQSRVDAKPEKEPIIEAVGHAVVGEVVEVGANSKPRLRVESDGTPADALAEEPSDTPTADQPGQSEQTDDAPTPITATDVPPVKPPDEPPRAASGDYEDDTPLHQKIARLTERTPYDIPTLTHLFQSGIERGDLRALEGHPTFD